MADVVIRPGTGRPRNSVSTPGNIFSVVCTLEGQHWPCGPTSLVRVFLPEVKRPGREASHTTLFSAEFRNKWGFTFTYQHGLIN